jgi:hypothetical protein
MDSVTITDDVTPLKAYTTSYHRAADHKLCDHTDDVTPLKAYTTSYHRAADLLKSIFGSDAEKRSVLFSFYERNPLPFMERNPLPYHQTQPSPLSSNPLLYHQTQPTPLPFNGKLSTFSLFEAVNLSSMAVVTVCHEFNLSATAVATGS